MHHSEPAPPPPGYDVDDVSPPPGPPPSHEHAPPAGPPPSYQQEDVWKVVPDTSLFPPPPAFFNGFDRSPGTNASEAAARAAEAWCKAHPLIAPRQLSAADLHARDVLQKVSLLAPVDWAISHATISEKSAGVWEVATMRVPRLAPKKFNGNHDVCLLGYPPLYTALHDAMQSHTAYYEVILSRNSRQGSHGSIALGFTALPYPSFRMPGWHRGSLAVHGDDGHRYINDMWGGKAFVQSFRPGETVGLGMTIVKGGGVSVFFTRGGSVEGCWDVHEERDHNQDRDITGLEGQHDLCAAVGVFQEQEFVVVFEPERWSWTAWERVGGKVQAK